MSQRIRVYLPATMPMLASLYGDGVLNITEGYAVTPALRAALDETDDEELSYAAYRQAAGASLRPLRDDPGAPRRRVVISVDVPAAVPAGEPGAVRLAAPVPAGAVVAIHVDGTGAEPAVAEAVAALAAGDDDAADAVDQELEWYDVSELAQLLA